MYEHETRPRGTQLLELEAPERGRPVSAPPVQGPMRPPATTMDEMRARHGAVPAAELQDMYGWLAEPRPAQGPDPDARRYGDRVTGHDPAQDILRDGQLLDANAPGPRLSEESVEDGSWLSQIVRKLIRFDAELPGGKNLAQSLPPVPEGTFPGGMPVGGADFQAPVDPAEIVLPGESFGERENALKLGVQLLPGLQPYGIHAPGVSLTAGKFRTDDGDMMYGLDASARLLGLEKQAREEGSVLDRTGGSLDVGGAQLTLAGNVDGKDTRFVAGAQTTVVGGSGEHYTEDGRYHQGGLSKGDGAEVRFRQTTDAEGNTHYRVGGDFDMYSGDVTTVVPGASTPETAAVEEPTAPPPARVREPWLTPPATPAAPPPLTEEEEQALRIQQRDAEHDPVTGSW